MYSIAIIKSLIYILNLKKIILLEKIELNIFNKLLIYINIVKLIKKVYMIIKQNYYYLI